jgi:hypothetical protein|nr:MAG TPA: hypothetical protein [Caudoviricetes sp.]
MTVREHVEIIDNPVVMAIEEKDGTQLYKGYKGCFEFNENNKEIQEREVAKFCLRVEGKRRTDERDKHVITELNCGTFNYADLHIALVYVYVLA